MNENYFLDDNDESDGSSGGGGRSGQRNLRNRTPKQLKKLVGDSKFLDDFDPEKSSRERRKLTRQSYTTQKRSGNNSIFDEKGRYRHNLADACDCLDNSCVGCHFPCPNCRSPKCGSTCRVNRKFAFETIEHDGKDLVINNKHYQV